MRRFTRVHEPTLVPAATPQATRSALGVTSILQELFLASAAELISGRISAPFSTSPVKFEGFQQPCHPIITDRTENLQLGKMRDQKKATQMYKKCLERNV